MSLIGFHADKVRQSNPDIVCPVKIANEVLKSLGVQLSGEESKLFAADLALARTNDNKGETNE
jgi:hypothetical protein